MTALMHRHRPPTDAATGDAPTVDWRQHAACRNHDPELWHPVGHGEATQRQIAHAINICHGCPVVDACRTFADHNREEHGIWGGILRTPETARFAPHYSICPHCRGSFWCDDYRMEYCSKRCSDHAYRKRRRLQLARRDRTNEGAS